MAAYFDHVSGKWGFRIHCLMDRGGDEVPVDFSSSPEYSTEKDAAQAEEDATAFEFAVFMAAAEATESARKIAENQAKAKVG